MFKIGDRLDQRFDLEAEVATGGMGRIFRAFDRQRGRHVAVKVLHTEAGSGVARFRREATLLAELSHPGIVEYIADGENDGNHYLVMAWLEGHDLGKRLRARAAELVVTLPDKPAAMAASETLAAAPRGLSLAEVVLLGRRVATTLAAIHGVGVVHRDIKPSNLFLVGGDVAQVVLVDFGIARDAAPDEPLTAKGAFIGTPRYMAPEQARGEPVGPAADVWALGCVLYECLTGRAPFAAAHPLGVLTRVLFHEPFAVAELRPDTPAELAALVHTMLSKAPEARPASGKQLTEALTRIATSLGEGRGTPAAERGGEPTRAEGAPPARLTERELSVRSLLFVRGCRTHDHATLNAITAQHRGAAEPIVDGATHMLVTLTGASALKDQAARAAHLALALRDAAPALSIVVATGRCDAGERAATGDATDRAIAALLSAQPGEIRMDRGAAGLLEGRFDFEGDGDHPVLRGQRATEGARPLLGKPSLWVGRRRELATLAAAFDECVEERAARMVLVTAPPGIGKSRLLQEFVHALGDRGAEVEILHGQAASPDECSPFHVLAPAIRRSAGILDGEPLEVRRGKLTARLGRALAGPELSRVAELLGELVCAPFPDESSETLRVGRSDPRLLDELMCGAFEAWLRAETERWPVALLLDDLQWGDAASVRYVDAALRALARCRLFVVGLARPEVHGRFRGLKRHPAVEHLELRELPPRACEELVARALGDQATPTLCEALVARSEGNALYLEELVRAAAVGRLDGLPDTVLGMVQARLAALDAGARLVLRAASVFGEVFWTGGVRALLGESAGAFAVEEWLADLVHREVIAQARESRLPGQLEYRFLHRLLRDAAYEALTESDRALGHRLAGGWLVQVGEPDPLVLAQHFSRGVERDRAAFWFSRAAEHALDGSDLPGAIAHAERAIEAGAAGAARGALRAIQAVAHFWSSAYAEAQRVGAEALALLPTSSGAWFRAAGILLVAFARRGNDADVDRLLEEILRVERAPGAEAAAVVSLCRGAYQLLFQGRLARADAVLARVADLEAATSELDALTRAQVEDTRGLRATFVGDLRGSLQHVERALDAFERAGDVRNACLERTVQAVGWAQIGDLARAEALCRDNLTRSQRLAAQQIVTHCRVILGFILSHAPVHLAEARGLLHAAASESAAAGNTRLEGWARLHLATVEHEAEDPAASEEQARAAVGLLRTTLGLKAYAVAVHARALLTLGRADAALAAAREATSMLERLQGLLLGETLPPLLLAEALRATGDLDGARDAIRAARARLLRRAERLEDPTWQARFLALPDNARTLSLHDAWHA